MLNLKSFVLTTLGLTALSLPVHAHHGTAVSYDQNKLIKVKGTVKEFRWTNPHSALFVDAKDAAGNTVTYTFEMGSPNTLAKQGMTRTLIKPGDEIEVEAHPSFTNPTSGEASSRHFVLNGKEMKFGNDGGGEGN